MKTPPDLAPRRAVLAMASAMMGAALTAGVSGCGWRPDTPAFDYALLAAA